MATDGHVTQIAEQLSYVSGMKQKLAIYLDQLAKEKTVPTNVRRDLALAHVRIEEARILLRHVFDQMKDMKEV